MATFVEKPVFKALAEKMKEFVRWPEIEEQQRINASTLAECRLTLVNFRKEHEQFKEMIRRFDEVISNKVNKETFDHTKLEIYNSLESREVVKKHQDSNEARLEYLEQFAKSQLEIGEKLREELD